MGNNDSENFGIEIEPEKILSLSIFKLQELISALFFGTKKPSFVKRCVKEKIKRLDCIFIDQSLFFIPSLEMPNVHFFPVQDNFSMEEISELIFKQEENREFKTSVNKQISECDEAQKNEFLKFEDDDKKFLKYFVIKDPFSVYIDDNSHINSIVSFRRKKKLRIDSFLRPLSRTNHFLIALDCEMVGTTEGSELGRVSVLGMDSSVLLDLYVNTKGEITDYRTQYSGLTESSFKNAVSFEHAQLEVLRFLGTNTILLGHSICHDLLALKIFHKEIIDTSRLYRTNDNFRIGLKTLSQKYLHKQIQKGSHDSYEDTLACLQMLKLKVNTIKKLLKSQNFLENVEKNVEFTKKKTKEEKTSINKFRTFFITPNSIKDINLEVKNEYNLIFYEYENKVYVGLYNVDY